MKRPKGRFHRSGIWLPDGCRYPGRGVQLTIIPGSGAGGSQLYSLAVSDGVQVGDSISGPTSYGLQATDGVSSSDASLTTGGSTLTGTVTLDGGVIALAGAVVQLLTGSTVSYTSGLTDALGHYSITGIVAGSYTGRLQPPLGYGLGAAEGDHTINLNASTTQDFKALQAAFYDDFNGQGGKGTAYTDSTDFRNNGYKPTRSTVTWAGSANFSDNVGGFNNPAQITLDPTGGPSGKQCITYTWPDRTSTVATAISAQNPAHVTVPSGWDPTDQNPVIISGSNSTPSIDGHYTMTRIDSTHFSIPVNVTSPGTTAVVAGHFQYNVESKFRIIDNNGSLSSELTSPEFWMLFDEYMSTPWQNGAQLIAPYDSFEYKFLRFSVGGNQGVVQLLIYGGHSSSPNLGLNADLVDSNGHNKTAGTALNTFGVWRRWHLRVYGVGTSTLGVDIYLNGSIFFQTTLTGCSWNDTYLRAVEMGANINSGPSASGQYRKFSLVHLSTTRPRLIAGEVPS